MPKYYNPRRGRRGRTRAGGSADGTTTAGSAAAYDGDGYDEPAPSRPSRPRRPRVPRPRPRPTGPRAWTQPADALARSTAERARMRTRRPELPDLPRPDTSGWIPGRERAAAARAGLAVRPEGLEDLELPVYLPGLDELKDMPLPSIGGVEELSAWEKLHWGKPAPEDYTGLDVMGQLAVNMFWRWGAELFYQLPKIPERLVHTMIQAGGGIDPILEAQLQESQGVLPPELWMGEAAMQTWNPWKGVPYILTEMPPEELGQYLREGEIGYTFIEHPERLAEFRADMVEGMAVEDAVRKHEDFWHELVLNAIIDPAWFIPAKAMTVLWPGGVLVAKAFGKGLGVALSKTVGRLPVGKWLTELSARTLQRQATGAALDAATEVILRLPGDEDVLVGINRILSGDTAGFDILSERAGATMTELVEGFSDDGIRSMADLVERYVPQIADSWGDDAFQAVVRDRPEMIPYFLGEAVRARQAALLGIKPVSERGVLARMFEFSSSLLKEHWLGPNPAYMIGNLQDNFVKAALMDHLIQPFDLAADARVTRYMAGYGAALPQQVMEGFIADELGLDTLSRTAQIPIPGIGKPAEVVDFYNRLLGIDLRDIFPAMGALAPERAPTMARAFELADSPGRMAGVLDKLNWASVVEAGRTFSGRVEQSARVQIFQSVFDDVMEGTARPRLVEAAVGLGDDIAALLGDASRVRSPLDILGLADELATFDPLARLSALLPEGTGSEVLGQMGQELDRLQRMAIGGDADTVARLAGEVEHLFDSAMVWADEVGHAANFERRLADWRGYNLQAAVGDLLERGREVSDSLLLLTREAITEDPAVASSAWARYFDQKQQISRMTHEEASRIIRERAPAMGEAVDGLLTRFEDVASSRPVGSLNPEDWGAFGQRLAELRSGVDDAFDMAWQALARNPTEDGLSTVETAYDAVYAHWEEVAGEASVWRDGYLTQDRRGTLRITAERYQERMNEIWSDGFATARSIWDDVALSLRPGTVPTPEPGAALYFVPREATPEQVRMGLEIASMRSGLSVDELRRIYTDEHTLSAVVLKALGAEDIMTEQAARWGDLAGAGRFFQGHISPTSGEVRLSSVSGYSHAETAKELWRLTDTEFSAGAVITYLPRNDDTMVRLTRSMTHEDALKVLQALKRNLGIPGDQVISIGAESGGWMDRVIRAPFDEAIEQIRTLARQQAMDLAEVEGFRPYLHPLETFMDSQAGLEGGAAGWIPEMPAAQAAQAAAPPPNAQQLKQWLDAGQITKQQYDALLMQGQEAAQQGFMYDSSIEMADRMADQASDVTTRLQQWRAAVMANLQEATTSRRLVGEELAQAQAQLRGLAQQWAGDIQNASIAGALEVRRVLFDYSVNQNWEEILRYFVPFHKWQLRNPIIWSQIMTQKPWVFSKITQYIRASEQWREEQALTGRFAGTMPVPGAIGQHLPAPAEGGQWAVDPRSLFSLAGQIREPFLSPQEEELTGWKAAVGTAARIPEYLGMHAWPWIEYPLEQAGVFGNRPPWGVLGTPGRVIPGLRRVEEDIAEARVPGSDWMMEYNVRRRIAELEAEGSITAIEAAEAQFNQDHPVYQRALQETQQTQDFMSQWRTMTPFGLKYASPGELQMRQARGALAERPAEEAAYPRSLEPGLRAYGRAMTGVEAPEQGEWQAKRDAIFARYDQMTQELAPWHPRYQELERAMWAEVDELGPAPEAYTERGYPVEGDRDAVLYQLEQARPKAQDFTDQAGQIDWDAYNAATTQYEGAVEDMAERWGVELSLQEYETFRDRFLSPLELAWKVRKEQLAGGWEEYGELKEERYPGAERPLGAGWLPGTAPGQVGLPSVEPMSLVEAAPEAMRPYVRREVESRMAGGWETGEIQKWLQDQGLPYEARQEEMERRGYGPMAVREMVPEVTERRPWLASQGYGAKEWGDIYGWLDKEMPGMFDQPTHADSLSSYYFDMMPTQRRAMEAALGIEEGTDIVEWAKGLDATTLRMTMMALDQMQDDFGPPSDPERMAAERDMLRWAEGLDEWSDTMTEFYGDPTSARSQFWDYWYDNKNYFSDQYQDDDIVQATLSKDVRSLMEADDFEEALYQSALERLKRYYMPEEAERWQRYPDLVEQAETEREEFLRLYGYGTKPEDDTQEERVWWDNRTKHMQDNPVMTWFYYYEKYIKWWGDQDPNTAGAYRRAVPRAPTPMPQPTPAPRRKKDKGGDGDGVPPPPDWP